MDSSEKEIKDIEELIDRLSKLSMGNINQAQQMETTEKILRAKIEKLNLFNLKEVNLILNNIKDGLGTFQASLSNLDKSIKDGIESNKQYSTSIKRWTIVLSLATVVLALIGIPQAILLNKYTEATMKIASVTEMSAKASQDMAMQMKYTNQANLSPSLSIIPMQPYYDKKGDLTMPYVVVNTGNTSLFYKKSHRIFKVNKKSGQKEEIKPWVGESTYTDRLSSKESSAIHLDTMGKYFIKEDALESEYFLVELKIECKNEIDFDYGTASFTKDVAFYAKSYIEGDRNEFSQIFLPPRYEGYENYKHSE